MRYITFISLLLTQILLGGCCPYRQSIPADMILPAEVPPLGTIQPQQPAIAANAFKKPNQEKVVVMLDPGHGGDDFGTHSLVKPFFHEKYLNLSCSMMVKNYLQQFGYEVVLTRHDDTFIPLDKRSLFANEQKPKLFVSIHFNSAPSTDAEGIEVFYYRSEDDKTRMDKSKTLAQSILNKTLQNTQAKSRGVKHGNYAVIRETKMPAALIEGGFLTNEKEMDKIKNAAYMKSLALGIAQGIQEYLAKDR